MIVALDGGAASGKSAVGRRVAEALGLPFVDTGLMYRAIAALAIDSGLSSSDSEALTDLAGATPLRVVGDTVWAGETDLTGRMYQPDVAASVSAVASVAGVREALVRRQRAMGAGGVVMAGRDIGTVVFPDADHKFFLTASLDERVRRRAAQFERRGEAAGAEVMAREIRERDRADSEREVSPLRAAGDAVVVDTDGLEIEGVVGAILTAIEARA